MKKENKKLFFEKVIRPELSKNTNSGLIFVDKVGISLAYLTIPEQLRLYRTKKYEQIIEGEINEQKYFIS